jgi:hypothetical protein
MSDDCEHAHQWVQDAVADERERCALLCEARGDISRASAAKVRKDGLYPAWFGVRMYVHPKWEKAARDLDSIAEAFDVVADCIRKGYDVRKEIDPRAQIKRPAVKPCDDCDFSTGYRCPRHR